jgi:hypothetical protein
MTATSHDHDPFGGNNDEGAFERQRGATTVEFAIVGAMALTVLFAIEIGRALSVWNTLGGDVPRCAAGGGLSHEPSRRHAWRFSATPATGHEPVVSGLSTANVTVAYLQDDGRLPRAIRKPNMCARSRVMS